MPSLRLFLAFIASTLIHAAILGAGMFVAMRHHAHRQDAAGIDSTSAMIEATLRAPAVEPLLKDTLSAATPLTEPDSAAAPAALKTTADTPRQAARAEARLAAQQKLSEHLYYPLAAITGGMEGEVRLLLTLATDGTVLDAQVARSSGHPVLDEAAVRAAFAMGSLSGMDKKEIILPVVFRLQP
jgi:protein TonB